jgi:hypothetical protein
MATKRKPASAPKPLDALTELVPKLSHAELIEATVQLLEDGAYRAANYADAIADAKELDGGCPQDIINEALVFCDDLDELELSGFSRNRRAVGAHWVLYEAQNRIQAARSMVEARAV